MSLLVGAHNVGHWMTETLLPKFEFQKPEVSQRQGPDYCPQLLPQDGEILVPVGMSRDIKVNGTNLPGVDRVCIYHWSENEVLTFVNVFAKKAISAILFKPFC